MIQDAASRCDDGGFCGAGGEPLLNKHLPEMQEFSLCEQPPLFVPSVDHTFCGMVVSTPVPAAHFAGEGMEPRDVWKVWRDRYADEPFVRPVKPGDAGKIMHGTYAASVVIIPESKMKEYQPPAKSLPRIGTSHEQNWIECCKTGGRACSDFSYAGPLTEFCLLGNVAIRLGGKVEWDAGNMKATGRPEADEWIRRPYREGWEL